MVTTCARCGASVRTARKPRGGTVRLDLSPDPEDGLWAVTHGVALVHDPVTARRVRRRGVPLYAAHACSTSPSTESLL